jgi:hypothetical protein
MGTLPEHWKDMDKASTTVFEEAREEDMECNYCDEKHQNGTCVLPSITVEEDSDVSVESGRMSVVMR